MGGTAPVLRKLYITTDSCLSCEKLTHSSTCTFTPSHLQGNAQYVTIFHHLHPIYIYVWRTLEQPFYPLYRSWSSLRRLRCTSIIEKGPQNASFIERFFVSFIWSVYYQRLHCIHTSRVDSCHVGSRDRVRDSSSSTQLLLGLLEVGGLGQRGS